MDERDGQPERFVPHRSEVVQSTAHANAYAERLIGSIRRECLDHVIVWNERGLRCVLNAYVEYHNDVSYCPTSLCA